MSYTPGVPHPEIPRFPGEPKLEGPPRRLKDSVFSDPGIVDASFVIADTLDLNSAERNQYLRDTLQGLSEERTTQLVDGIVAYSDEAINGSSRLRGHGKFMISTIESKKAKNDEHEEVWKKNPAIDSETDRIIEESGLETIAEEVSSYFAAKPNKRDGILAKTARDLFDSPLEMLSRINHLEIWDDETLRENPFFNQLRTYKQNLIEQLSSIAGSEYFEMPEQRELFEWLYGASGSIGSNGPGGSIGGDSIFQTISEKHLTGFISRCSNLDDVTDACYKLAQAGIMNGNKGVIRYTLEILYGLTPIMPTDSLQYMDYHLAKMGGLGETQRKALELHNSKVMMTNYHPGVLAAAARPTARMARSSAYRKRAQMWKTRKQARLGNAQFDSEVEDLRPELLNPIRRARRLLPGKSIKEDIDTESFSETQGPLIDFARQIHALKLARKFKPEQQKVALIFPDGSQMVKRPLAEIRQFVKDKCHKGDGSTLADRKFWQPISYLLPEAITSKKLKRLEEENTRLQAQMKEDQVHTLSPRGDKIEITDPLLQDLGFSNLTYKMSSRDKAATEVTIQIGNYSYKAQLTPGLDLVTSEGASLYLPEAGTFIRHVVLSHLHEILCTDNVGEVSEDGSLVEERAAFTSRRAHRRILPEGEKPTPKQIAWIQKEYGIDLRKRNGERRVSGEDRLITWVSQVDSVAIGGQDPVVSKAPNATDRLRKILS